MTDFYNPEVEVTPRPFKPVLPTPGSKFVRWKRGRFGGTLSKWHRIDFRPRPFASDARAVGVVVTVCGLGVPGTLLAIARREYERSVLVCCRRCNRIWNGKPIALKEVTP